MFPQVKRVLMTLGFVFVLEAIGAVHACILFFGFVYPGRKSNDQPPAGGLWGPCGGLPQFFYGVELFGLLGATRTDV